MALPCMPTAAVRGGATRRGSGEVETVDPGQIAAADKLLLIRWHAHEIFLHLRRRISARGGNGEKPCGVVGSILGGKIIVGVQCLRLARGEIASRRPI